MIHIFTLDEDYIRRSGLLPPTQHQLTEAVRCAFLDSISRIFEFKISKSILINLSSIYFCASDLNIDYLTVEMSDYNSIYQRDWHSYFKMIEIITLKDIGLTLDNTHGDQLEGYFQPEKINLAKLKLLTKDETIVTRCTNPSEITAYLYSKINNLSIYRNTYLNCRERNEIGRFNNWVVEENPVDYLNFQRSVYNASKQTKFDKLPKIFLDCFCPSRWLLLGKSVDVNILCLTSAL